jgi:hypothetical protein
VIPLEEGEIREITVVLRATSFVVRAGYRLRLCLSGADFPELWPTQKPYQMHVHRSGSTSSYIDLPVVPPSAIQLPEPRFGPPDDGAPAWAGYYDDRRDVLQRDVATGDLRFETLRRDKWRPDARTTVRHSHLGIATVERGRPWLASVRTDTHWEIQRPSQPVDLLVRTLITAHKIESHAKIELDGQPFFERTWSKQIG